MWVCLTPSLVSLSLWPRVIFLAPPFPRIRPSHNIWAHVVTCLRLLELHTQPLQLIGRTELLSSLSMPGHGWTDWPALVTGPRLLVLPLSPAYRSMWLLCGVPYHPGHREASLEIPALPSSVRATHLTRAARISKLRARPPFFQGRKRHLMLGSTHY